MKTGADMHIRNKKYSYIKNGLLSLVSIVLIFALLPLQVLAKDETEASSQAIRGVSEELENPVQGLLDENPVGLPEIQGQAYLVYDTLSDTMLVGNEYDTPMPPAGITQIMTILLALETLQLDHEITIKSSAYESIPNGYVRIGFTEGEIVTVEECLYSCILKSANDACMALALEISGSEAEFVKKMNERAIELGCTHTHFSSPYGRTSSDHYSSCHDMALILEEALKHPEYIKIATSLSYTMEPTNKYNDKRIMNNGNRFVSTPQIAYEFYIGGKTGYTDTSGYTIIAGAEKEGKRLIGVILHSEDAERRYSDMMNLLEYCFSKYTSTKIEEQELLDIKESSVAQINAAIEGTSLTISSTKLEHLDYYSVPLALADIGYSNTVDLSNIVIQPDLKQQEFVIPIDRVFTDSATYRIGYLSVEIVNGSIAAEAVKNEEKKDSFDIVKWIVIILVVAVLCCALAFAILLFFKLSRKRKMKKNHKNPTIL